MHNPTSVFWVRRGVSSQIGLVDPGGSDALDNNIKEEGTKSRLVLWADSIDLHRRLYKKWTKAVTFDLFLCDFSICCPKYCFTDANLLHFALTVITLMGCNGSFFLFSMTFKLWEHKVKSLSGYKLGWQGFLKKRCSYCRLYEESHAGWADASCTTSPVLHHYLCALSPEAAGRMKTLSTPDPAF